MYASSNRPDACMLRLEAQWAPSNQLPLPRTCASTRLFLVRFSGFQYLRSTFGGATVVVAEAATRTQQRLLLTAKGLTRIIVAIFDRYEQRR